MVQLIISIDCTNGLMGCGSWDYNGEYTAFENIINGKTIIVGVETARHLRHMPSYTIICITDDIYTRFDEWDNKVELMNIQGLTKLVSTNPHEKYIILGGGGHSFIDSMCNIPMFIDKVHLIQSVQDSDRPYELKNEWVYDFVITHIHEYNDRSHIVLDRTEHGERQYLNTVIDIIKKGNRRESRSGTTLSMFKKDFTFDLRNGFPLMTTKKMFWRGIVEEFIFFLKGYTDSTLLSDKKIRIWEGNTSDEFIKEKGLPYAKGVMGPMYGYQWRYYNAPYNVNEEGRMTGKPVNGIDQLKKTIYLINNNPTSRRILMTVYNPIQAELGVLYPCHSIVVQFYVQGAFLDMFCYNRSQDVGLGVPFNIASSSLLLCVVAKMTHKTPRFFHMSMGDTHIYEEHVDVLSEQTNRIPYAFPHIDIPDIAFSDIESLQSSDFKLLDYTHYPNIKMKMKI